MKKSKGSLACLIIIFLLALSACNSSTDQENLTVYNFGDPEKDYTSGMSSAERAQTFLSNADDVYWNYFTYEMLGKQVDFLVEYQPEEYSNLGAFSWTDQLSVIFSYLAAVDLSQYEESAELAEDMILYQIAIGSQGSLCGVKIGYTVSEDGVSPDSTILSFTFSDDTVASFCGPYDVNVMQAAGMITSMQSSIRSAVSENFQGTELPDGSTESMLYVPALLLEDIIENTIKLSTPENGIDPDFDFRFEVSGKAAYLIDRTGLYFQTEDGEVFSFDNFDDDGENTELVNTLLSLIL